MEECSLMHPHQNCWWASPKYAACQANCSAVFLFGMQGDAEQWGDSEAAE
jgi:hypothetical protein